MGILGKIKHTTRRANATPFIGSQILTIIKSNMDYAINTSNGCGFIQNCRPINQFLKKIYSEKNTQEMFEKNSKVDSNF